MNYLSVTKEDTDSVDGKLLLLGSKNVGKSALVVRYLTKRYIGEYDNTFDARYMTTVFVNNQKTQIELYDPRASSLDTEEIRKGRILWAHGFILIYSVTDRQSFDDIFTNYNLIRSMRREEKPPIIIIANKTDLVRNRRVTRIEGQRLAQKLNCTYYETSAAVLTEGYISLCDAINEIGEAVITKRRTVPNQTIRRRRSISPRPIRKAFVKMFGRQNQEGFDRQLIYT